MAPARDEHTTAPARCFWAKRVNRIARSQGDEHKDQHRHPMPASLDRVLGNFTTARKILPKINSIAAACYVPLSALRW